MMIPFSSEEKKNLPLNLLILRFSILTVKPQQSATPYKKQPPISSGPIKPRAMMAPMVSPKSSPDVLKTGKEEKDIKVCCIVI